MKCPACGQWNRASMPHCQSCGAPLNIDEASRIQWKDHLNGKTESKAYIRVNEYGEADSVPDARDQLAREMSELKKRKTEGEKRLKNLRTQNHMEAFPGSSEQESSALWEEIPSSVPGTVRLQRVSSDPASDRIRNEIRRKVRYLDSGGAFSESAPSEISYIASDPSDWNEYESLPKIKYHSRHKKMKTFGLVVCCLIACTLLFIGVLSLIRYFSDSRSRLPENSGISVTASMMDDLAAHTIFIPGEDKTQIYIRELHKSYEVTDGFATIQIPDHTWYDNYEGVLEETMNVTLTPFLKTSSGRQLPLDPISYPIYIPLSPITLESPESLRSEVATTMATIRIVVRPGSKVTVNGDDYSDTVQSDNGEMSYNATVHPIGDNHYNIVVRSPYCRDNSIRVIIYREPQEIPLDLAVGTYSTTYQKAMKVSATTMAGAYVTVESPHSDLDITNLATTGKFSFYAIFDTIGNNTIEISASYPGKKTSVVKHTVYYVPPVDEYSRKAWALYGPDNQYQELIGNIAVRTKRKQIYVIKGIIQYFVSVKPQMVVINTSEDGKSMPVLVQNYTDKSFEEGKYFTIYADAYSTYNNMPWLNARYASDH